MIKLDYFLIMKTVYQKLYQMEIIHIENMDLMIIGWSVENIDDVRRANGLDVDYIGISPVFATPTKTDTAQPFGIEGTRQAVALSVHPTVGIGGINHHTIDQLRGCGLDGVAVVSDIMAANDPRMAAQTLFNKMK